MITDKERAELAEVCYMTVERESAKPVEKMNIPLIDACISLANKLLNIHSLSKEEIETAKQKIMQMGMRRRRKLRVRIIAAVLVLLLLLGTTVYAFTDWLDSVFGHDEIWELQPGDKIEEGNNVVEKPADSISFNTIEELADYIEEPIYLPMDMPEEYVLSNISIYEYESRVVHLVWVKDHSTISFMLTLDISYCNEEMFLDTGYDFDYYSKEGHPFEYIDIYPNVQALGYIDDNEYAILAADVSSLTDVIDSLIMVD